MKSMKILNHNLATIGNGALLIWWGIVIMIDPLTIGMGAVGTGIILLGVNAARLMNGIPAKDSTTYFGIITLFWGMLDIIFNPGFELSFAIFLIEIGILKIASLLKPGNRATGAA